MLYKKKKESLSHGEEKKDDNKKSILDIMFMLGIGNAMSSKKKRELAMQASTQTYVTCLDEQNNICIRINSCFLFTGWSL